MGAGPDCSRGLQSCRPGSGADGHDRRAGPLNHPDRGQPPVSVKSLSGSGSGGWGMAHCRQDKQTAGQVGSSRGSICSLSRFPRLPAVRVAQVDAFSGVSRPQSPGGRFRPATEEGRFQAEAIPFGNQAPRALQFPCSVGADRRSSRRPWRSRLQTWSACFRRQRLASSMARLPAPARLRIQVACSRRFPEVSRKPLHQPTALALSQRGVVKQVGRRQWRRDRRLAAGNSQTIQTGAGSLKPW